MNTSFCLRASLVARAGTSGRLDSMRKWTPSSTCSSLSCRTEGSPIPGSSKLNLCIFFACLSSCLRIPQLWLCRVRGRNRKRFQANQTGGNRSTGDGTLCLLSIPWNIQVRFMLLYATKILGTSGLKLSWMWTVTSTSLLCGDQLRPRWASASYVLNQ